MYHPDKRPKPTRAVDTMRMQDINNSSDYLKLLKGDGGSKYNDKKETGNYNSGGNDESGSTSSNTEEDGSEAVSEVDTDSDSGSDYDDVLSDFTKGDSSLFV